MTSVSPGSPVEAAQPLPTAQRWARKLCGLAVLALGAAIVQSTAAEVFSSDPRFEISGTGARASRICRIVLKPVKMSDDLAPRLIFATSGQSRLSFNIEGSEQYSAPVIVQNNLRKPIAASDGANDEQFRQSDLGKALRSKRLFFITAQHIPTGKSVSSRYEGLDFDDVLTQLEAACPFDAESFLSNASSRQKAEQSLLISPFELTFIRWALNKQYAGQPNRPEPTSSLSQTERGYLKRYAADNDLPISEYLTATTARRLAADGQRNAGLAVVETPRQPTAQARPSSPSESCTVKSGTTYCASSVLAAEFGFTYGAEKIADGRLDTAWVPGQGTRSDGIGEWIVVRFGAPQSMSGMQIFNGYNKNPDIFRKNNRVRDVEIHASNGFRKMVTLSDAEGSQTINFDTTLQVEWIALTIRSVYRGIKYHDTAISELKFTP